MYRADIQGEREVNYRQVFKHGVKMEESGDSECLHVKEERSKS